MPVMDGIEATRRIVALRPRPSPRVLVMTTFDLDEHIIDALRAGASGFLVKDAPPEDLVAGRPADRRRAGAALARRSPGACSTCAAGPCRRSRRRPGPGAGGDHRPRAAVLKLVARGLSNNEIAQVMDLALSSVKTHVGHLLAKLQPHRPGPPGRLRLRARAGPPRVHPETTTAARERAPRRPAPSAPCARGLAATG